MFEICTAHTPLSQNKLWTKRKYRLRSNGIERDWFTYSIYCPTCSWITCKPVFATWHASSRIRKSNKETLAPCSDSLSITQGLDNPSPWSDSPPRSSDSVPLALGFEKSSLRGASSGRLCQTYSCGRRCELLRSISNKLTPWSQSARDVVNGGKKVDGRSCCCKGRKKAAGNQKGKYCKWSIFPRWMASSLARWHICSITNRP